MNRDYARANMVALNETPISSPKYNQEIEKIFAVLNHLGRCFLSKTEPDKGFGWLDSNYSPARFRMWHDDEQKWLWEGMLFGTEDQKPSPESTLPGSTYLSYDTKMFELLSLLGEENEAGEMVYSPSWTKIAASSISIDPSGVVDIDATDVQSTLEQLSALFKEHKDRQDNPHKVVAGQVPSDTPGLDGDNVASELASVSRELGKRISIGDTVGTVPVMDGAGGYVYSAPIKIPVMDVSRVAKRAAFKYGG